MALNSMQEIFEKAASRSIPFWRVVLETDMEERQVTEEQSMEKMRAAWHAMLESVVSYQGDQRSRSGLVGGDGAQMRRYAAADTTYSGPYVQEVIATALSVGESNACMRKIVAAPTAGACGVLPAVLVPLYQMGRATEEEILQALYTASGIGAVVSFRACIAGASGGCQADRHGFRYGGWRSDLPAGRRSSADRPRGGHGPEKSDGFGVRPGGGSGGSPLREAECGRLCQRRQLRGYGAGRRGKPDPCGRGHRLHG